MPEAGHLTTPLGRWLLADHEEMDALRAQADGTSSGELDPVAFEALRARLLRHIAIEEKLVFPAVARARGGVPLDRVRRLHLEHAAMTSLLVPTPDLALVRELGRILDPHDVLEDGPGGVYQECEAALGDGWVEVFERARQYPPIKVAAHVDGPRMVRTAEDALRRAGLR